MVPQRLKLLNPHFLHVFGSITSNEASIINIDRVFHLYSIKYLGNNLKKYTSFY
jgi:hypothetical protein